MLDFMTILKGSQPTLQLQNSLSVFTDRVETLVLRHDRVQKMHKLVLYMTLKAQADCLLELKQYDNAIKAYKSVKNYIRRW